MTPEEFQKWLGDTKIETTIESISKFDGMYNLKKAWKHIKVGEEYWFFNTDNKQGPTDWMKLKVTYKRSSVFFFKVFDKRYKNRKEEYADIDTIFTRQLHPAEFKNTNPKYFKVSSFDTLDGRIKII